MKNTNMKRYWKFLKKKCLYNHFYNDVESFCNAIETCLADSDEKFREELKTLRTLKFQCHCICKNCLIFAYPD